MLSLFTIQLVISTSRLTLDIEVFYYNQLATSNIDSDIDQYYRVVGSISITGPLILFNFIEKYSKRSGLQDY